MSDTKTNSPAGPGATGGGGTPGMAQTVFALGAVRHACHMCGTCCTGWRVQLKTLAERQKVLAQAEVLGVVEPIIDGSLRRVKGRCVFLGEDKLCAIHARFGESEKPNVCQHFPRRSLHTEEGVRIGADPGCSSTWRSFDVGPELPPWEVRVGRPWPIYAPEIADTERSLLAAAREPGMTVARYMAILSGETTYLPNPPPQFLGRLLGRISHATPYLADRDNGPLICETLEPIATFLAKYDQKAPPPWRVLEPRADAFAMEIVARHLFMRLGDTEIPPMGHTLLVLGGIAACALVEPSLPVFGPALSAWSRMCRLDKFWIPVMPTGSTAAWILTGKKPEAPDMAAEGEA